MCICTLVYTICMFVHFHFGLHDLHNPHSVARQHNGKDVYWCVLHFLLSTQAIIESTKEKWHLSICLANSWGEMLGLAQENSTRNINVLRCWWSNRSELALHHIFEWVNGGKSSLMSLGPAEIISADIFLQSATPWGGRRGHLSTICTMLGAKQIDLNICLFDAISHHWFKKPFFPCLWKLPKTARAPLA